MKNHLFLLLFILPFASFAQDEIAPYGLHLRDGKIIFEYVVNLPGVKEETIYAAAHKWIADNYRQNKVVVQTEEREIGQIIASGSAEPTYPFAYPIRFQLQADCRDNKYRIRFYELSNTSPTEIETGIPFETAVFGDPNIPLKPKELERVKGLAYIINKTFESLKKSMVESIDKSSKDTF